jgi:hypothetical protein
VRTLSLKTRFHESAQFPLPQRISDQELRTNLVLTEKTGPFWGVLAGKSMFHEIKIEFVFVFLRFFAIFRVASHCRLGINSEPDPPKKIIPKSLR